MTLDLDALEKIANAATPGPWINYYNSDDVYAAFPRGEAQVSRGSVPNDAAHIAAFDPPTVLALIEAARERDHLHQFCYQAAMASGECGFVCSETIALRAELTTLRAQLAQAREALQTALTNHRTRYIDKTHQSKHWLQADDHLEAALAAITPTSASTEEE